jgi:hypothetical protein
MLDTKRYERPPLQGLPASTMVAIAPGIFVNEKLLIDLRLVPMRDEAKMEAT